MLSITDQSARAEVLGDGLLENSDERELTPEELAQGYEHAQAYEDVQRQDIAAETVEAVMVAQPATDAEFVDAQAHELESETKPA
jgi:hypothetical protein